MKVYVLLAQGFEIVEAMLPIDILRRAKIETLTVSINDNPVVEASNGTSVVADLLLSQCDCNDGSMLFLPGGMPGSSNLHESKVVNDLIMQYHKANKWLVAICAAPMVFGRLGILAGEKATCFPGFEQDLLNAEPCQKTCVRSGHFITGCGAGAAFALGREMVAVLKDEASADDILRRMMFQVYE